MKQISEKKFEEIFTFFDKPMRLRQFFCPQLFWVGGQTQGQHKLLYPTSEERYEPEVKCPDCGMLMIQWKNIYIK